MQRVVQRAERATRQAARKMDKSKFREMKDDRWTRNQQNKRAVTVLQKRLKDERVNRKIDWEAGPLAPKRDVGEGAETYGSLSMYDFATPDIDPRRIPKWWPIGEGDRVVVIKGRDQGKIGLVVDIKESNGTVSVRQMNEHLINTPEWMSEEQDAWQPIQKINKGMPLDHVRLVYPLSDPKTGVVRDVIIDRLVKVGTRWDDATQKYMPADRAIAGTDIIIPHPPKADYQQEGNPDDTTYEEVKDQTFRPSLIYSPMPTSVIDELRNKFSKFRTRHTWDYREQQEATDAQSEKRQKLAKTMRTPLQELADLRAEQKKAADRELTDEQLEKIGAVIARGQSKKQSVAPKLPTPE